MTSRIDSHSRIYVLVLAAVTVIAGGLAYFTDSASLGLAAAVLGLYVLHLHSIQVMQRQWRTLQGLERIVGEIGGSEADGGGDTAAPAGPGVGAGGGGGDRAGVEGESGEEAGTVHREFGLGTVAVVKGAMSPAEVSEVMAEQRRHPERTFGDHAIELGHVTERELEELVQVKHRGRYPAEEVRRARGRIRAYRRSLDPGAPAD